ncbi:hypothetical protein DFH09DRAFT_1494011 [Mycena vulgaris]|nr:hypothetical protein DFH09DRAFT_1494011 [Mycena vulgaris]
MQRCDWRRSSHPRRPSRPHTRLRASSPWSSGARASGSEDAVVLVCVAQPISQGASPVEAPGLAGHWVGSAILRGPFSERDYALPTDGGAPPPASNDEGETKWQMTAVFASATHRGHGLGKMLIQAGKDYAMAQTADPRVGLVARLPERVRLRVMIHPDNLVVLSLYSGTGFVDAGRTTGKEAYRTNGDMALWELKLDSLTDEEKIYWSTARVAVVMEWLGETKH